MKNEKPSIEPIRMVSGLVRQSDGTSVPTGAKCLAKNLMCS